MLHFGEILGLNYLIVYLLPKQILRLVCHRTYDARNEKFISFAASSQFPKFVNSSTRILFCE